MDQDVIGWSPADIALLIQSLARPSVEQFVHDHPFLQQRALAGFSKRLPPNYPQRLANCLAQRAELYQQTLQELIKHWRQEKQSLCEIVEHLEPPITLETLAPLLAQHGGRDILAALHTDPRAETFGDTLSALRLGIERREIPLDPPTPAPGRRGSTSPEPSAPPSSQQQAPTTGPANHRAAAAPSSAAAVATLPRPSGGLPHPVSPPPAPKTTLELFAALETELQALHTIQQTIETCGAQLAQHQQADDPQALARILEKLNAAHQKRIEGFARFAALDSELLSALHAETQQAEAAGQVEGLSASLPASTPPSAISEASARLQAFRQTRERLTAALTLNEQRLAALKAAPATIETLLHEIDELEGESGPLRARLAALKTTVPENASVRQIERALQMAEKVREQALTLRNGLLQDWHTHLLRACRDSESLLNQSLHLSADLPEITNLQQSLQQARAILAALLIPDAPVPLPFPPAQIIAHRQQLLQHGDHLRRALATYNPQIALAFLHDVELNGPAELTPLYLQQVGAALVGAASLRAGYSGVIWRVGATLLAALDNTAAEQFYERFGFAAVATAIAASLRNGDFPLGLTFAENEYLFYTDADIGSVFSHERVLDILSYTCATATFPTFPADCFANASPAVRRAALELLLRAAHINFPPALRLQLSAALLAAATSPEERAQAGRLLIRSLIDQRQSLNAYCAWRALALEQPNLYPDQTGLDALFSLIWRFTLDAHTPTAPLAALCADSALQEASFYVPGIALALALAALALARARHPRGEEWGAFFLDALHDHHHYLAISDALRARFPRPADEPADSEESEVQSKQHDMQAQLNAALAEADRRIQVSNYRFAPTKQLRNQIDAQLQPILAALQQGHAPAGDLGHQLHEADPSNLAKILIQEAEKNRRQEGRDPIEGDDLKKLRKDLENLLKHLVEAARARSELAALRTQSGSGAAYLPPDQPDANNLSWENHETIQAELRRLLTDAPQSRDLLQQALPNISLDLS